MSAGIAVCDRCGNYVDRDNRGWPGFCSARCRDQPPPPDSPRAGPHDEWATPEVIAARRQVDTVSASERSPDALIAAATVMGQLLDGEELVHIGQALNDYVKRSRTNGCAVPPTVVALAARLSAAVRHGHGPSKLAGSAAASDGAVMRSPLLTRREAVQRLRCSESTLGRKVRDGELPAVRVGTLVRFRVEDLDAYLERNTTCSRPRRSPTP